MSTAESKKSRSYGRIAYAGVGWVGITALATKVATLVSQIALGWLLSENDFALYALAISVTAIAGALRDGGTVKLLIQRGSEYASLAPTVATLSLCFNVAAGLLLLCFAPFAASFYNSPLLLYLIAILAVAMPLGTAPSIYRAKLTIDLRFQALARVDIETSVLKQVSMIGFAVMGLGPFSFVLPQLIDVFYQWFRFKRLAGAWPTKARFDQKKSLDLLSSSKWIIIGAIAIAIGANGDYMVVGRITPEILGIYFFGYQLAGAVSGIVTKGLQSVVMPVFSKIASDRDRLSRAYTKSFSYLVAAGFCLSGWIVILSPPLISFIWQGKWNASIIVVQCIGFTLGIRLLSPISGAIFESLGKWRLRSILIWIDAVLIVLAATLGALWGTPTAVAICVGVERIVIGLLAAYVAVRVLNASIIWELCKRLMLAMPILLSSVAVSYIGWRYNWLAWQPVVLYAILTIPWGVIMLRLKLIPKVRSAGLDDTTK